VSVDNAFQAIFRLVFIQEDKDFMLELYDYSIEVLGDKLAEEFSLKLAVYNRHQRARSVRHSSGYI
jgi:hypothetical protein